MSGDDRRPVIFLAFANDRDERARYLRNLPEELRRVRGRLESAETDRLCEVVVRTNTTISELLDIFQDPRYRDRVAVFHFGGHAGGYQLLLESAQGRPEFAHAEGLADFLGQQRGLQLVFLNGCSTEPQVEGLLRSSIPAVIATSESIDDSMATELGARFYAGLSSGATIATAYAEAVAAVKIVKGGSTRDVYRVEASVSDRWPWDLHVGEGADIVRDWSLPKAAGDPLFGLPPLPEQDLPEMPYRHLQWFRTEDAELFFGRGREIRSFYELVTSPSAAPIVLFYGQTGVGKSSMLAAGLVPRLGSSYEVRYARRGDVGLTATLAAALGAPGPDAMLAEAWRAVESKVARPLVVILDQVEEVFTRLGPDDPHELERFLSVLSDAFAERPRRPRGKLVLAFRKEWLADIEARLQERKLPRSKSYLERIDRDGIIEIVQGPARSERLREHFRLAVETGLAVVIADDLLEDRDAPVAPTLEVLLTKMWTQATARNTDAPELTTALYQELRRKGLLLDDFLVEQLNALRNWNAQVVDTGLALDVLAFHTTPLGTAESRTRVELDAAYPQQSATLSGLLQRSKDLYLLVDHVPQVQEEVSRAEGTRLAHDTLAPLVRRRFKDSDAPGQRARRILENRCAEWRDGKTGDPLDQADLATVERGEAGMPVWSPDERRLIQASAALRDRRSQEAEQHAKEREESRRQLGRQLAEASWLVAQGVRGNSYAFREESPIKAAHYLLRASSAAAAAGDVLPSRDASLAAQIAGSFALHTFLHDGAIFGAITSPDGQRILTLSMDGTARLWQSGDGTPVGHPMTHEDCDEARFSPDGRRILTWSKHGAMRLWDAADGTPVGQPIEHEDYINGAQFSADGQRILAWNTSRSTAPPTECRAQLWQAIDGTPVGQPMKHENWLQGAQFSADGQRILTWSEDGTARLWQATDGTPVGQPMKHDGAVNSAQFSADGQLILTCGGRAARLWQAADGRPVGRLMQHEGGIYSAEFSADGQRILTSGGDKTARLWQVGDGTPVGQPMQHQDSINGAEFSADGQRILTWSEDDTARLWQATDGTPVGQPMQHEGGVEGAQFSADGQMVLSWSRDGTARLWQADDGTPVGRPMQRGRPHTEAEFSPDGQRILTWSDFRTVQLWQASNGMPVGPPMAHEGWVDGAQFSTNGQQILTWSRDGTARFWKETDGTRVGQPKQFEDPELKVQSSVTAQFSVARQRILTWIDDRTVRLWEESDGTPVGQPMRHETPIVGARFSDDGRRMLTWSEDGTARLWETAGGTPVGQPMEHQNYAEPQFSGDGQRILTWIDDDAVRLWQASNGKPVGQPMKHEDSIKGAQFSADGQRILTWSRRGTVRLWEATDGTPVGQMFRQVEPKDKDWEIREAQFSADGRRILTLSNASSARLWQAANGIPVGETMDWVDGAQFSADGQQLLTWGLVKRTVQLWQTSDGSPVGQPMNHAEAVFTAQFSADGKRILTGTRDGTLRVWCAADWTLVGQPMLGGSGEFSADGQWILTWSDDGTVRLWSVGSSQCIAAFKHEGSVESACFNRDETRVLTASEDGTARLWDISFDESIPVEECVLEFEVRSATTLGSDGQVRVLRFAEWEQKKAKLLEAEIRFGKAIVPRGDAPPLTPKELSARQRQLAELRQRLSK